MYFLQEDTKRVEENRINFYDKALIDARDEIILNQHSSQIQDRYYSNYDTANTTNYFVNRKKQAPIKTSPDSLYNSTSSRKKPLKCSDSSAKKLRLSLKKFLSKNENSQLTISHIGDLYNQSKTIEDEKLSADSFYVSEFVSVRL